MGCSDCTKSLWFWAVVILITIVVLYVTSRPPREGYKDPLFMNVKKFTHDYYPKSNGSIYGLNYIVDQEKNIVYPEGQNMFSGYPYYWRAY